MNTLVMEVNQGCPRGFALTLLQNVYDPTTGEYHTEPVNLNEYNILCEVKLSPYRSIRPLIKKIITTDSDEENVGKVTDGIAGKFTIQITEDDLKCLAPQDYSLLLYLENNGIYTNIGADGNQYAIFRVCHQ